MGDRCYMQVRCRAEDAHLFTQNNNMNFVVDNELNGVATLVAEEANYAYGIGCGDDDEGWPKVPFVGFHTAGTDYGEAEFCFDDKLYYVATLEGDPVVRVTSSGVIKKEVQYAKDFLKATKRVEKLLCKANNRAARK